jgi:general secretion pathway protein D
MLDSKRMHANEQLNTIVIRDQPEKLEMAEKIILANDRLDSEVLFDVEVLEVDRTVDQTYGLTYPKSVGAALVPPGAGVPNFLFGQLGQQFTYRQLTSLGQDSYLFKLPTNVQLDFLKQITDAKTLASPKIRVVNNKKAEINIGDKQPILLSTTNVLPGQAATGAVPTTSTVTSIEFRDTGVKLTVEPSIHLGNELSLKMKIEVVRLGEQVQLSASPLITQFKFGNRSAETMLNIRDGETIVLGGLLQEEDRKTRTTIPWIGDLPFIGNLLSSFRTQRVTTEVILTITPHIIQGTTPPGLTTQVFWSGTDSSYSTSPMFTPKGKKISMMGGGGSGGGASLSGGPAKGEGGMVGKAAAASLAPTASIGAVASIRPDESVIQMGKEFKLAINDERLRPTADGVFQLQYDPQVLELRKLLNGEVIQSDGTGGQVSSSTETQVGMVAFKVAPSARQAGGRTVTVTFYAKAPGVSPVRVALVDSAAESSTVPLQEGKGIVRVR